MEDDIGVKLFHRGTRKITLTNEGMLLRRRAEEILQLVDNTEMELVEQEEQIEGKITIGCGELASVQILSELISDFSKKYHGVTYDVFTATADVVKEQMDKGLIDIGLLLQKKRVLYVESIPGGLMRKRNIVQVVLLGIKKKKVKSPYL